MRKLVFESLNQLFEAKDDKAKAENIGKVKAKMEKSKAKKQPETKESKADQAIAALKDQITKAKKPGAFKTTKEKTVKIAELEAKIKAWEKKK